MHWLMRMSRWARRPPSMKQVIGLIVVVAICFALYLLDSVVTLPDWLQPERIPRRLPH